MKRTAIMECGSVVATVFENPNGKVIEIHLDPEHLTMSHLKNLVEDSDSGFTRPFGEWLSVESKTAKHILFTGLGSCHRTSEIKIVRTH